MKKIFTPILLIVFTIFHQAAISQTKSWRVYLSDAQTAKLKNAKPEVLKDTFLVTKGFKAYSTDELARNNIDLSSLNFGRLTLDQLKLKLHETPEGMMPAPLFFQKNIGQSSSAFDYILQTAYFTAGLNANSISAIVLKQSDDKENSQSGLLKGNKITLQFKGGKGKLTGEQSFSAKVHSYVGNAKAKWFTNITTYKYLINKGIYKGVNLVEKAENGRLIYSFVLEKAANAKLIHILVDGGKVTLDTKGHLIISTSGGKIVQTRPNFYEVSAAGRKKIKGEFILYNANEYGFKVTAEDPNAQILIDPEIIFTTYFGGSATDGMLDTENGARNIIGLGFDIQIGPDGDFFIVGRTSSPDFPVTNSGAINGGNDIFVMRINPNFQLAYCVFIGGSSDDRGRSITVSDKNFAYVTGWTSSTNFPFCISPNSCTLIDSVGSGGYVAKLNPAGEFLRSTLVGAHSTTIHPNSIKFDRPTTDTSAFIYIAGATEGSQDATSGSFQTSSGGGGEDGFIAKIDTNLSQFKYFTYLGGSGTDFITDIDVKEGFAFVTGVTASSNFPISEEPFLDHLSDEANQNCTGSTNTRACADAFVTRINQAGSDIVYSTFFGKTGREDFARGIAVNQDKQAFITGASRFTDLDSAEVFVAKFSNHGDQIWERFIPAKGRDHGEEIVVDQNSNVYITGTVSQEGLQFGNLGGSVCGVDVQQAPNAFHGGTSDIFYARFLNDGTENVFYYLGGENEDRGFAIAASANDEEDYCTTIVGSTVSDDIQTINSLDGGNERKGNADLLIFTLCNITANPKFLAITKSAPEEINQGGQIVFNMTVMNCTDANVAVTVTDRIPTCILNPFLLTGTGCNINGNNVLTCNFNAVPGPNLISVTGTIPNNCTCSPFSNQASLSAFGEDLPGSNITTTTITGCNQPPPPPPPPSPCVNDGICKLNRGENCTCDDCRLREGDLCDGAPCPCPAGTRCKGIPVSFVECDPCCGIPIAAWFCHCGDVCGFWLLRYECTAE